MERTAPRFRPAKPLSELAGSLLILASIVAAGCDSPAERQPPREFQKTASGLQYRIRREGTGPYPELDNLVQVHYRGWLDDGTVFDTTYDNVDPAAMFLDKTIKGWQEAVPLCREGGAIELIVPPELGYGAEGSSTIPPNARLHFLIEIVRVVD